jgi:antitoxin ParD1/3/4
MRTDLSLTITLPEEISEMVRFKVDSGEFASENEVVLEGLRTMSLRDNELESWLNDEVLPAYDAIEADPSRAVPIAKVRASLASAYQSLTKTT